MSYDDTFSQKGPKIQEDIKKTPEERELEDDSTLNEYREKIILTQTEVREQMKTGHFPFNRIVEREVNGEIFEVIQELFRFDAIGRVVRNDDVAGTSWQAKELIPHDRYGECPDHFDKHGARPVFLGLDGFVEYETVLCAECKKWYEDQLFLERWTFGLLRAKHLKEH